MDQQNWWEADPVVTQASPRMVPITPADPIEQGRYDLQLRKEGREAALAPLEARKTAADVARIENDNANADLSRRKMIADAAKAEAEAVKAARENGGQKNPEELAAVRAEAIDKIKLARSLQQRSREGWFTTGFGSAIARQVGGTGAYDLAKDTDTLRNAGALTRIMEMAKQNGGKNPLTPLSNSDFEALASSLSNIDPSQSDEQYQANVQRIIDLYQRAYQGAGGTDLEGDIDPSKRRQPVAGVAGAAMPGATPGAPNGGGGGPRGELVFNDQMPETKPGAFRYTPEQEATLTNIARQGGDPTRLMEAARSFGAEISPESAKQVVEYYSRPEHRNETIGVDYGRTDALTPEQQAKADQIAKGADGVGAAVMGAGDTLSVGLLDEAGAAVDAAFGDGNGSFSDRYNNALAINRNAQEQIREQHTLPYVAGQIGGGILLPSRIGAAASTAGRTAIRAGMSRADAIRAAIGAGARRSGLEGGAFGAAYGFGSADGDLADRAAGGAVSGATGLLGGYVAGRAGGALAGRGRALGARGADPARASQVEAAQAASDLGIDLPRYVAGGAASRRLAGWIEGTPFGAAPIRQGVDRMLSQADEASTRIASDVAPIATPERAGEAAISGAKDFLSRSGQTGNDLYAKAERLSGPTRVPLNGAKQEVQRQIAELSDTPGVTPEMLGPLQSIAKGLDGEFTPASIRRMRTQLTDQFVSGGMQQGDASRRARIITNAAEDDMVNGLIANGQADAAKAWQRASNYWRARSDRIENALTPILGKNNDKTADDVARALSRDSKGNGARLATFLRSIPRDEASEVRSTLISQLGKATDGNQNAAGDAFSFDTFLTNWNRIKGSRERVFSRDSYLALNKLAKVAERAKEAGRSRNVTNSGNVVLTGATFAPAGSILAGNLTGPLATVGMALAQYGGGKLLASPRFAQRLVNMPTQPQNALRFWQGDWVNKVARSEPAVASELLGLRDYMVRNLSSSAPRLAASPNMDTHNGVDDNR